MDVGENTLLVHVASTRLDRRRKRPRGRGSLATRVALFAVASVWGLAAPGIASAQTLSTALAQAGRSVDAQAARAVFVNGERLDESRLQELERLYSARLADGRYWYDPVSGLWGSEGGPATGQIHPGLELGGPLRPDASAGGTSVFINGREVHSLELEYLQEMFGHVVPGRYWLNAAGLGGREGGPPTFDLVAALASRNTRNAGCRGGYIDRGPFGTIGGDGGCFYFSSPDGSGYLPPGC